MLVVRRELLRNRVPTVPGGGTVDYVNPSEHRYVTDPEHREEGGTPAIVESIRAGLVFQLKQAVGTDVIRAREEHFLRRAVESWLANPAIEILGNLDAERLSIMSFVVRRPGGRYLHHNAWSSLLNDLFGIQSRGGCSCAGPYGHRLLGIDIDRSHRFEQEIVAGCEGIKPGWVRVSFNYFISPVVFDYIVEAVDLVATYGWALLPDYRFDPYTGLWRHHDGLVEPPLRLSQLSYDDAGRLTWPARHERAGEDALAGYLAEARTLLTERAEHPLDRGRRRHRGIARTSRRCAGSNSPTPPSPPSTLPRRSRSCCATNRTRERQQLLDRHPRRVRLRRNAAWACAGGLLAGVWIVLIPRHSTPTAGS